MKRNNLIGLAIGLFAGIVDLVPMTARGLTWDANLSALTMWIVIGFFLSVTRINVQGWVKGLLISLLILLPNLFLIGWKEPASLIPVVIMTVLLGSLSGFVYSRIVKE